MSYKSRRNKKKGNKAEGESGSYLINRLAKLAREARAMAASPSCGCTDPQSCSHVNPLWIERAEKIERVRGAEAMGLANLSGRSDFWNIVDRMKPKVLAKKMPRPKSSQGISMKGGIAKLRDKAKAKAVAQMCTCPPWVECNHDPKRDGGVWSDRLRKLSGLGQAEAMRLLSHIGTQDIWDVVDQLVDPSPPIPVVANEGTTLNAI